MNPRQKNNDDSQSVVHGRKYTKILGLDSFCFLEGLIPLYEEIYL